MPRVVTPPPTPATQPGCKITGRRLLAGGTPDCTPLEVTPGRSGVYNGVIYTKTPILVEIQPDGQFEMVLPPSSVLGVYKVQVGALTWNMVVPDAPNANFDSIARL